MVCAERSREVTARREKAEATALAYEMRLEAARKGELGFDFYFTSRAKAREPIR
jgi:hypothetical protein